MSSMGTTTPWQRVPTSLLVMRATFVYPTGGKQAIDWARELLVNNVNPPLWLVLPFDTVSPDNAQQACNDFACPAAE